MSVFSPLPTPMIIIAIAFFNKIYNYHSAVNLYSHLD